MPNSQTTHPCAALECRLQVGRQLLMCQHHWRQVPVAQQRAVNRSWRALNGDRRCRDALQTYRTAVKAAIDSITTDKV